MSATLLPHNSVVRTPTQQEIETNVYESLRRNEDLYWPRYKKRLRMSGKMTTHRNKGAYGTEAGQHPCLDRERDLWREDKP